ncbi:MAG: NADH-quinone oxidoreductase subunit L [Candidatus Marsarchaeota archaeon]|nr:NADH-quinone oxidoreductase subunit L [Candidatus Marsarchaeota archaeon]
MLTLLIILPLLAASFLVLLTYGREKYTGPLVLAGSLITSLMILYASMSSFGKIQELNWFGISGYTIHITTQLLPLNVILSLLIGLITPLIMFYSMGYMEYKTERPRFFFEMGIFASSMLLFAIAGNFITMFIAWEMLGITSYLLIGFWYKRENAPYAARKSISTIIIGDFAMLAAMLIIWSSYHTFSFASILASPSSLYLSIAMFMVLIACFTKSAQFPFHEWLSDAMEGPTPVSAFLHSSTMVKAGVFLVLVLFPLFMKAGLSELILAIGIISAVLGASNAISSHHVKKILAYSTIEDLGLMFVAIGLHAIVAAVLFFIVQAFYKALLFMSAGSIMRANNEEEDIYKLYGSAKRKLLYIPTVIGVLSIAGIFPLSGFFGKAAIDTAAASNAYAYIILVIIDFATSAYIFRWLFIHSRKPSKSAAVDYSKIPKSMVYAGVIASILVVLAAFAFFDMGSVQSYSDYSLSISISVIDSIIETAAVAFGLVVSYLLFMKAKPTGEIRTKAYYILFNSVAINAAYLYISKAVMYFAEGISVIDELIYGFFASGGEGLLAISDKLRKIVTGDSNNYLIAFVAGIILIILLLLV